MSENSKPSHPPGTTWITAKRIKIHDAVQAIGMREPLVKHYERLLQEMPQPEAVVMAAEKVLVNPEIAEASVRLFGGYFAVEAEPDFAEEYALRWFGSRPTLYPVQKSLIVATVLRPYEERAEMRKGQRTDLEPDGTVPAGSETGEAIVNACRDIGGGNPKHVRDFRDLLHWDHLTNGDDSNRVRDLLLNWSETSAAGDAVPPTMAGVRAKFLEVFKFRVSEAIAEVRGTKKAHEVHEETSGEDELDKMGAEISADSSPERNRNVILRLTKDGEKLAEVEVREGRGCMTFSQEWASDSEAFSTLHKLLDETVKGKKTFKANAHSFKVVEEPALADHIQRLFEALTDELRAAALNAWRESRSKNAV